MTQIPLEQRHIAVIPLKMAYLRDESSGQRIVECPVSRSGELDIPALCIFIATGMFLGTDTYFRDLSTVRPGEDLIVGADRMVVRRSQRFDWGDDPEGPLDDKGLDAYLDEFDALLEAETAASGTQRAVLALSGGLDSRSLAAAMCGRSYEVRSYGYAFHRGVDELKYGRAISRECGFAHAEFTIPPGYLWNAIERFPAITNCYAEFTHARQMAVLGELAELGDTFYLGHLGDALFTHSHLPASAGLGTLVKFAARRLCKSSGMELARGLWREHGLQGSFDDYLEASLVMHLEAIRVADANARMRAFKCLHWVPRWTSVNLSLFSAVGTPVVPYYSDEMCSFVRRTPAAYLEDRLLQIEYIKRKHPALAKICWQAWAPFDLHTYKSLLGLRGVPVRVIERARKEVRRLLHRPRVRQNWQNQFLGAANVAHLSKWLLETPELLDLVPKRHIETAFQRFQRRAEDNWHAISMLLTLAVFSKHKSRWIEAGK